MGQTLTRKKRIKVIDLFPPDQGFDYSRPKGKIICRKDAKFHVMKLEITAEGWFTSNVRLCPKGENVEKFKIFRSISLSLKSSHSSKIVVLTKLIFNF